MNEIKRQFLLNKIEIYWRFNTPIYLDAPHGCGKTFLLQRIPDTLYIDCKLPIDDIRKKINNSSLDTRFAIDNFELINDNSLLSDILNGNCRIIITGNSQYFHSISKLSPRDFIKIYLNPIPASETEELDIFSRLTRGGLPLLLNQKKGRGPYAAWLNNIWANTIKPTHRIDSKKAFITLIKHLAQNSGCQFDAKNLESTINVSRTSIKRYFSIACKARITYSVKPFATSTNEITGYPRAYFFDTGFIYHFNNWKKSNLRQEDYNIMWKTLVINELIARLQTTDIFYWKDKRGHEMDFVLKNDNHYIGIHCAWQPEAVSTKNMRSFKRRYNNSTIIAVSHTAASTPSNSDLYTHCDIDGLCEYILRNY